jgi:hypothetical protein
MQFPPTAMAEWRRIGFAFVSLFLNMDKYKKKFLERRRTDLLQNLATDLSIQEDEE